MRQSEDDRKTAGWRQRFISTETVSFKKWGLLSNALPWRRLHRRQVKQSEANACSVLRKQNNENYRGRCGFTNEGGAKAALGTESTGLGIN